MHETRQPPPVLTSNARSRICLWSSQRSSHPQRNLLWFGATMATAHFGALSQDRYVQAGKLTRANCAFSWFGEVTSVRMCSNY